MNRLAAFFFFVATVAFLPTTCIGFHVERQSVLQRHSAAVGPSSTKLTLAAPELNSEANLLQETLTRCALDRSVSSDQVIDSLEHLQSIASSADRSSIFQGDVAGTFELVFSSAVAKLPVIGFFLDGYLPNKEAIVFDFERGRMSLAVETLPFLPTIHIEGEELTWEDDSDTLTYKVKGKDKQSQWKILYADDSIVAAKSSVTGLNIIRRVD